MSREIKFRGWNKKNGTWLYGFYLQNRGEHFVCPDELATGKVFEDYEVDLESVGQFTGLCDKNGKEMYEGDILYSEAEDGSNAKSLIGWNEDMTCFGIMDEYAYRAQLKGYNFPAFDNQVMDNFRRHCVRFEIIGNIYENPELLKQEQQ